MSLVSRHAGVVLFAACSYAPLGLATDGTPEAPARAHEAQCGEALTIWRKARDPGARDCCALVVVGNAGLWTTPARTHELAARASALCPSGLEAAALHAASLLAMGDWALAHQAFERIFAGSAESFAQLSTAQRLLVARAASLAGERGRALDHYRSVILDLDQLQSPHERARVLLEAAMLAARATPPELAEAHAYLRQSSEHSSPRLYTVRRLVARAIEFGTALGGEVPLRQEDPAEIVAWMLGGARLPLAAPGGLLPVLEPDLLADLLPRELLPAELVRPARTEVEIEALP